MQHIIAFINILITRVAQIEKLKAKNLPTKALIFENAFSQYTTWSNNEASALEREVESDVVRQEAKDIKEHTHADEAVNRDAHGKCVQETLESSMRSNKEYEQKICDLEKSAKNLENNLRESEKNLSGICKPCLWSYLNAID